MVYSTDDDNNRSHVWVSHAINLTTDKILSPIINAMYSLTKIQILLLKMVQHF